MSNRTPRILIIEDSETQAQLIAAQLSGRDVDVLIAEDGPPGLRLALGAKPDLIVLDIHLPTMNGYQVCRRLKRDPQTSDIPIIMLTSADSADEMIEGLEAGAIDYIAKDEFATENLLATLRSMQLLEETE